MKKLFLIVSVALATIGNVMAQDTAPKREGWQGDLYGDVVAVEVVTYVGTGRNMDYFSSEVYQFNDYGNVDCIQGYVLFGMPTLSIHYTYDDQQRLTVMEFRTAEDYLESMYTYSYDENGNVVTSIEYDGEQTIKHKTLTQFDSNNNEIEEVKYDGDAVAERTTWAYNSRGECIEKVQYEADGSVKKYCYEYSEYLFNKPVSMHVYSGEGLSETLINSSTITYNTDGKMIEYNSYNADGELQRMWSYKYDGGKLLEQTTYTVEDGELVAMERECYSYDHMGNISEIASFKNEGEGLQSFCTIAYLISYKE